MLLCLVVCFSVEQCFTTLIRLERVLYCEDVRKRARHEETRNKLSPSRTRLLFAFSGHNRKRPDTTPRTERPSTKKPKSRIRRTSQRASQKPTSTANTLEFSDGFLRGENVQHKKEKHLSSKEFLQTWDALRQNGEPVSYSVIARRYDSLVFGNGKNEG